MAQTKDGKHKSSKFRAARYDREHAKDKPEEREGEEAHKMQAKGEGNPEEHMHEEEGGGEEGAFGEEEKGEEMLHPGIHEEIKGVAAEHGPAHTVNMVHDPQRMTSHVHSIHADGHEHHADMQGEGHVQHAHEHGMHAAGLMPKEETPAEPNPDEGEAMPMNAGGY
jgi:hypothetical protein